MGYEADLGLNPDDLFPMSQPIWEDIDFEIPVDEYSKNPQNYWKTLEKKLNYKRPIWSKEIGIPINNIKSIILNLLLLFFKRPIFLLKILSHADRNIFNLIFIIIHLPKIVTLSKYDFVIAYGIGPSLSYLAGVKYASIPYGRDLLEFPFEENDQRWYRRARCRLQRIGYQKSNYVFSASDPRFSKTLKKLGIKKKYYHNSLPYDLEKYNSYEQESFNLLLDFSVSKNLSEKVVFLMPSRIDFKAKGTDKVIEAFKKLLAEREDIFLIFLSWGKDLERAKKLVLDAKMDHRIYFHPFIISKPRLIKFMNCSDVILDQFTSARAIGTTTLEAMACGKPVITSLDWSYMDEKISSMPPSLNANNKEEIFNSMKTLCDYKNREEVGKLSREWIRQNHSTASKNDIVSILKSIKNNVFTAHNFKN